MSGLAKAVWATLLSTIAVASWWIVASASLFPVSRIDLDRGQKLFATRCSSCHSVSPGQGASMGPDLSSIGKHAGEIVVGMSAEDYLAQSILKPNAFRRPGEQGVMPADIAVGLDRHDVASLVGFLTTLEGSPKPGQLARLAAEVVLPELKERERVDFRTVEAGKRLFAGKGQCATCHILRQTPGMSVRAPSLLASGHHDAAYLRDSICRPSHRITAGYEVWNIPVNSGKVYSGRLLSRDSEALELLSVQSGRTQIVRIPLERVERDEQNVPMIGPTSTSSMPDGLTTTLSELEIDQIVAFLKTLR